MALYYIYETSISNFGSSIFPTLSPCFDIDVLSDLAMIIGPLDRKYLFSYNQISYRISCDLVLLIILIRITLCAQ